MVKTRRRIGIALAAALGLAGLPALVTHPSTAAAAVGPGYWVVDATGHLTNFGAAENFGQPPANFAVVDIEARSDGSGVWVVDPVGRVVALGGAQNLGDRPTLRTGERVVSIARSSSGNGYWLMSSIGRTFNYGDAPDVGDVTDFTPGNAPLNQPIIDAAKTVNGTGVYMVAQDGGVFAMGDAPFLGSMGGKFLASPVRSLVPDPDGRGYWLIAGDGGVFSFEALFKGSMGGTPLNGPVVGMVAYGDGYLQVGSDGGVFNFSTLPFLGSLGGSSQSAAVIGIAAFVSGGSSTPVSTTTTTLPNGSTTTTTPGATTTTTPPPAPGLAARLSAGGLSSTDITRSSASADGCKVAFESDADLAPIDPTLTVPKAEARRDPNNSDSDPNNQRDIFLWNCADSSLKRVTNGFHYFDENNHHPGQPDGLYPGADNRTGNGSSVSPSLSSDGRYLAFSSRADDPGIDGRAFSWSPYHHAYGIFVLDTVTGVVNRVDDTRSGEQYYGQDHGSRESAVQISANGQFIVYQQASRVVGGAALYGNQIYMAQRTVSDWSAHRTTLVSSAGANEMAGGASSPTVSTDGTTVAFTFEPYSGGTTNEIYVWTAAGDLFTNAGYWTTDPGRTSLPSGQTGTVTKLTTGAADSTWPRVSADGSRIAFISYAALAAGGDTNAPNGDHVNGDADRSYADLFVCSRGAGWSTNCAGALNRITNAGTGSSGRGSLMPSISADGRYVAFQSDDLTPLDSAAGAAGTGVFVYDISAPSAPSMRLTQFTAGLTRQGPFLASGSNVLVFSDGTGDYFRQSFT